jgi:hypothetical protein
MIPMALFKGRSQAGILDAGLSSLANFVAGVYAARFLSSADLGSYALVFSAVIFSAIIPAQLIFVPIERDSLLFPTDKRLCVLRRSLSTGLGLSAVAAVFSISFPHLLSILDWSGNTVALTVTGGCCALAWPIQDHLRRLLHCASMHFAAAFLSGVNLLGVVVVLLLVTITDLPRVWAPLGSLAAGNVLSIIVGLWLCAKKFSYQNVEYTTSLAGLISSGKWLLGSMIVPAACGFAVASIMTRLGGREILGQAEAARIVGSPVLVLAMGLSFVIRPDSMAAGNCLDSNRARLISGKFSRLILASVVLYGLIAGHPWGGNPMRYLVSTAFNIPGLVMLTVISNGIFAVAFPQRFELIGCHSEKALLSVEILGNMGRLLTSCTVGLTHAFALPLSFGILGFVRLTGFGLVLRKIYAEHSTTSGSRAQSEETAP